MEAWMPDENPSGRHGADGPGIAERGDFASEHPGLENGDTVFIVDSDDAIRDSLVRLLSALPCAIETFVSGEELLREKSLDRGACLITEMQLPGMCGLELLQAMERRGKALPTILLASNTDVPTAVQAMRAGAVDLIEKPFVERVLLSRVRDLLF